MGLPHNHKDLVAELRRRIIAKYARAWRDGDIADRISFGDPTANNPQAFERDKQTNYWMELTRPPRVIEGPEERARAAGASAGCPSPTGAESETAYEPRRRTADVKSHHPRG